jgi:hypothetical protein
MIPITCVYTVACRRGDAEGRGVRGWSETKNDAYADLGFTSPSPSFERRGARIGYLLNQKSPQVVKSMGIRLPV